MRGEDAVQYLRERGVVAAGADARVRELPGGISNTVLRVDWAGGAAVVKQSLPRLRVEEAWDFDPRRILTEAECLRALTGVLPAGSVPTVLDVDDTGLTLTMTCAPGGGAVWKDVLLRGEVDATVARRAGDLLGTVHRRTAGDPALAARFADLMPLLQGRVDPYHRATARRHPDLAALIEADAVRLQTRRRALVLGDYSPKNLIVYPDRVLALDFEVAHWGDPAFDTAFMLTHLVAKAVHRSVQAGEFLAAAEAFWAAYRARAGASGATEADTAAELGVLLLCRVDGKSRLEYLSGGNRELVRGIARRLIARRETDLAALLDAVSARVAVATGAPAA